MTKIHKTLVVGAGIGGLTCALALAKRGMLVTVCEQAACFSEVGAGLQIGPNAMHVLRALGLEEDLKALAYTPNFASIRHYKTGEYYLKTPLGSAIEKKYGAPYWHLHRADLHAILVQACEAAGVEILLNAQVKSYQEDAGGQGVKLYLENGWEIAADLVVASDGVKSSIRQQMLGMDKSTFMGQVAWRGLIPVESLSSIKIQADASVWAGPGRHFVSYYVRGGQYINFVAVEERNAWHSESWREEGDVNVLRQAFAGWHPEVTELLKCVKSTFLWSLNGRSELPFWHKGPVVLLGDACHPMLPFMAQGAAMAIEDAYILAECVSGATSAESLEQALQAYEQHRKPRTSKVQAMSKANAGLFHMHGGVLGLCKLKALKQVSHFVPSVVENKLDFVYGYNAPQQDL